MTFRLKPIAAALAASAALGFAQGSFAQIVLPPSQPITFDPTGKGSTAGIVISTFDWAPSSLLTMSGPCPSDSSGALIPCVNAMPVKELVEPSYLKSITHAALQGGQDPNGNAVSLPGLNTSFEITFVAGACVRAQPVESVLTVPKTLLFTLNPSGGCTVDGKDALHPNLDASGQFFEIWYDDLTDGTGTIADSLSGTGYRDGKLILSGNITQLDGQLSIITAPSGFPIVEQFDQFPPTNDWGNDTTLKENGSVTTAAMITGLDKKFFTRGLDVDSFLKFTGETKAGFQSTNPSKKFYSGGQPTPPVQVGTMAVLPPDHVADIGSDGLNDGTVATVDNDGKNTVQQADANQSFVPIERPSACRVTGGGNDTSGLIATLDGSRPTGYDGTKSNDKLTPTKLLRYKGKKTAAVTDYYYYTFGGQAGANTALLPQPKGQWEHNNHSSPTGLKFAFHGGKNAPDGTQIDEIRCTDPGWCVQARPAPDKQIDFTGIGTFSNLSGLPALNPDGTLKEGSDGVIFEGIQKVIPEPTTGQPGQPVPSYHWFQVHIEDLGEPGSQKGLSDLDDSTKCPQQGSGNNPFANPAVTNKLANCDCRDFYRLTIYKGVVPAVDSSTGKVVLDGNGDIPGIDKTNKIYEVYGYIEGGNFQIHPLTGFDLH